MPIQPGPIRSILFVPGNKESWMRNALGYAADALIFDLDDAVPVALREAARASVRSVLESAPAGRPLRFVRVGDLESGELVRDLRGVVCRGLSGVLLPHVRDAASVVAADVAITAIERERGLESGSLIMMPLLETAEAVRTARAVALASPRVAYMGAGVSARGDIARAVGYRWTPAGLETLYFRAKVLLEMRAAGIAYPISGLWGKIEDLDGLVAFAEQTRDLGYTGMMAIHPSHLEIINRIFTPSAEEIAGWRRQIERMASAQRSGEGAIRHEGELLDEAHIKTARQSLEFVRALGIEAPLD